MGSAIANVIISIVLFSLIVIGFTLPMTELATTYSVSFNSSYQSTYNRIEDISNATDTSYKAFQEDKVEETSQGVNWLKASYKALKLIFIAPTIMLSLMNNIALDIGLPQWSITGLFTIMLISIIFMVSSAVIKWWT